MPVLTRGAHPFPLDPPVGIGDHRLAGASWEDLDRAGAEAIGRSCLAVPSVRVALSWSLRHLRFSRHRDHVLVPRFTSRCILTTLARRALPVEEPTDRTRLALVVHQYGLRQDLDSISRQCTDRGWSYVEDAAYGPDLEEGLGPGCLARFIGLTKTLPVLKGALVVSEDESLLAALRHARTRSSPWALLVFGALSYLRAGRHVKNSNSQLAELAYEMYEAAGGDHRWTRGNILRGLARLDRFAAGSSSRRALAVATLGDRLVVAEKARTPYVGAWRAQDLERAAAACARSGFPSDIYNIDMARDLFAPRYERAVLIPFNPRIPAQAFECLLDELRRSANGSEAGSEVA